MKRYMQTFFLLSILFSSAVYAQHNEKPSSGIVPVALPYYTPETSLAVGGVLIYYDNPDPDNPESKNNEIMLWGAATIKKQVKFGTYLSRYVLNNDINLFGKIEADSWPSSFWGIGPDTKSSQEESYTSRSIKTHAGFMKKVTNALYIGPRYNYSYLSMEKTENNGQLSNGDIRGANGNINSGPAVQISYDTRNSNYYPDKGLNIEVKSSVNNTLVGSSYNYSKLEFEYIHFYKLTKKHILAFQSQVNLSTGELPFQALYEMGGETLLRGIYQGRFRDRQYMATQLEYRYHFLWKLDGALFAGLGEVSPTIDDFDSKHIEYAYGTGIRYTADQNEHINLRLDLGFNANFEPSVYFTIKEAF